MFPCLCILLSFVPGKFKLTSLESLKFKESNRYKKTLELLSSIGCSFKEEGGDLLINGKVQLATTEFNFDADQDHRMAFATGLLIAKGFKIKLTGYEAVKKSYPNFWQDIEVSLV